MSDAGSAAPSRTALILGFATVYLVWGSTYLGIRVAVETLPPFLMASFRFLIAGGILFAALVFRGAPLPTLPQWRDNAIVGFCLLLGGNAIVSWAEQRVPSGLTTLILGASPLIMVILDWLRPGGARPAPGVCIGIAVGIAGLVFLLWPGSLPASARPPFWRVAALIFSSTIWWVGSFYGKHARSGGDTFMAAAIQMLCGSAFIAVASLAFGEFPQFHLAAVSTRSWWAFAYLVVFGSLVTFPVYVWLLKHSTPARVSTYAYVNPVVAVILGWAILDEPLTLRIGLSAAVIIAAVAIITTQKHRIAKAEPSA